MSLRPGTLAAIVVVTALVAGCDPATPASSKPASSLSPAPSTSAAPLAAQVDEPIGLAVVGDQLWAVSADDAAVFRVDQRSGRVTTKVPVGDTPLRAAVAGAVLWVSVFRAGKVVAVDTATGTVTHSVAVGAGPEGVAVGFGAIWVVSQDARELTRLSVSGRVLGRTALVGTPRLVAIGPHGVYVTDVANGTLARFDRSGTPGPVTGRLCAGAQNMTINNGIIWIMCTAGNEVVAVDESTMRVRGRVAVPGEPDAAQILDGHVWIAGATGPRLTELSGDPDAPAIEKTITLGRNGPLDDDANVDLTVAGGRLWVSSNRDNGLYAVETGS